MCHIVQFNVDAINLRLASWCWRSLVDRKGNPATTPILFKDTTFLGSDPDEPKGKFISHQATDSFLHTGNKLCWSAGMMLAVLHDFTALFEPLIPEVPWMIEF